MIYILSWLKIQGHGERLFCNFIRVEIKRQMALGHWPKRRRRKKKRSFLLIIQQARKEKNQVEIFKLEKKDKKLNGTYCIHWDMTLDEDV